MHLCGNMTSCDPMVSFITGMSKHFAHYVVSKHVVCDAVPQVKVHLRGTMTSCDSMVDFSTQMS